MQKEANEAEERGCLESNFGSDNCCDDCVIRGPMYQDKKFIRQGGT